METSKLNTAARMKRGGSMSEGKFEAVYPGKWLRTGFDHPDWSDGTPVAWDLPPLLTAMPDYFTHEYGWVECVGCHGDIVRSVKVEKVARLRDWQSFTDTPVSIFIWNTGHQEWAIVNIDPIPTYMLDISAFHDGPMYYRLAWEDVKARAFLQGGQQ